MFTGLVEEIGTVENIRIKSDYAELEIKAEKIMDDVKIGDSISTNGVCLTVSKLKSNGFTADVMPESMKRTNLGELKQRSAVNLERAMSANGRFGGHIVSGHIDGTGKLKEKVKDGNAYWLEIEADKDILKYVVFKGSITLDGTSLTIAYVDDNSFKVSIIPLTGEETTLLQKNIGDKINIECDLVGKYIEKMLKGLFDDDASDMNKKQLQSKEGQNNQSGINENFLKLNGFI